jgi:hypothetical protein
MIIRSKPNRSKRNICKGGLGKRVAGSAPSRELCDKVQGPLPGEGAALAQWPVKGLLEWLACESNARYPGTAPTVGASLPGLGDVSLGPSTPQTMLQNHVPEPCVSEGTAALNQKRTSTYDGKKSNWNAKGVIANCPKSTRSPLFCVELFPKNKRDYLANSTIRKAEV